MQLALYMRPHMTLKLDSGMDVQMMHTHLVVFCKCTSKIGGGLCATVGSPHLLQTLHAASLDTLARLHMIWCQTGEFFSVLLPNAIARGY